MNKKLFLMIAMIAVSFAGFAQDGESPAERTFTKTFFDVEIAVNVTTGQLAEASFYVEGYVYPAGTLADAEFGGVNADGTAEFPDAVIGRWTCTGWLALPRGEGEIPVGAMTTQCFEFQTDGNQGSNMVVTTGFEPGGFGRVYSRSVVGATGDYADADNGVQTIQIIGINETGGLMYKTAVSDSFQIKFKSK